MEGEEAGMDVLRLWQQEVSSFPAQCETGDLLSEKRVGGVCLRQSLRKSLKKL